MKKSYIILAVAVILALTTMVITNSAAQGPTPKLSTHNENQNWPSMSGFCISKFADLTAIRALNISRVEENLIIYIAW
jgi:hypothetical protein